MKPHDSYRKQLVKLIEAVTRDEGMRKYEVLRSFLEAGYRAIRGRFLIGDAWQQNEDEYMKIVRRCQRPDATMARLSEMLAVTVEALEAECSDFLGPTFMEIGGSGDLGQFFTPNELSHLMARMTIDVDRLVAESPRGYFTAQEPAAGMGGMVLAVARLMREKGFEPARQCHWLMVDVEFNAMAGCYIQTSLAGISGIVVHGDTLRLKEFQSSTTPTGVLFPKTFRAREPEGNAAADAPPAPQPAMSRDGRPGQLSFDFVV